MTKPRKSTPEQQDKVREIQAAHQVPEQPEQERRPGIRGGRVRSDDPDEPDPQE